MPLPLFFLVKLHIFFITTKFQDNNYKCSVNITEYGMVFIISKKVFLIRKIIHFSLNANAKCNDHFQDNQGLQQGHYAYFHMWLQFFLIYTNYYHFTGKIIDFKIGIFCI